MGSTFRIRAKLLARVVAPILFATALSACSTVPDWVDPTTWIGGDSQASSDQTSDAGTGTDQSTAAGTDQSAATGQEAASAQPSGSGQTPDIAAIPPKPAPPSTADEQKQVADSLAADRAQAHYSADALRGGTEAAAAPPSAEVAGQGPASSETPAASASSPSDQGASAQASAASADNQNAASPPPPADATAQSTSGGEAVSAQNSAAPAMEAASPPAPNQVASTNTASTSAPAAAPLASETGSSSAQVAPDMQATFAPSKAPALDPSVSQYVPQQILSHYQETAAAASVPVESSTPTSAKHRHRKKIKTSQGIIRLHYTSRSSVSRTAMIQKRYSPGNNGRMLREAVLTHSSPSYGLDRALFTPANKPALAVVAFTRETTILDSGARNRIQSAARNFVAQGGTGFMRVVGRASDPANSLPRAIRLRNNFERSEAQATAVARELIRDGVPPQRVLVEAVGDSPVGDHYAPRTSRSAEIFLQS
jgi:hypothetical protein